MGFEIREAESVPPIRRKHEAVEYKFNPVVEAAMASESGVVALKCGSVKEARSESAALHVYLKRLGLQDVFRVNQRLEVVFVTELSRAGTDRDPRRGGE